ncbi:hypoxanthine phosphoribosyltransferase [Peptoniphilus sp. oral taxon 386]|uniref:hypoxanthine phosphoribosyltransferase n=1 Tax=Peptoniphilus sp. oral taxon 386 TaxID=652713 RepID=UPI0001DAA41B|nr:hypoxanthine phosphoribosyltransferase [Peptoniphilus sp. oral taxon 386]EFI41321.1 hypoxanthine phosphoribosyltransferase [Peptoniphilus sp. oral taxon 386 str. F0131]
MTDREKKIIFTREEITKRIKELGAELTKEYKDKDLIAISLLRGSFIFAADLVREIDTVLEIDFLTTASYGNSEVSSGRVKFLSELRSNIKGRDVLVIDDIVDTGHTMKSVVEKLKGYEPKSIKTCVMLDKPSRREVDIKADYVAFEIPDLFIVGYGLNYGDFYRNVPYIYAYV